jgi:hypothetical protein
VSPLLSIIVEDSYDDPNFAQDFTKKLLFNEIFKNQDIVNTSVIPVEEKKEVPVKEKKEDVYPEKVGTGVVEEKKEKEEKEEEEEEEVPHADADVEEKKEKEEKEEEEVAGAVVVEEKKEEVPHAPADVEEKKEEKGVAGAVVEKKEEVPRAPAVVEEKKEKEVIIHPYPNHKDEKQIDYESAITDWLNEIKNGAIKPKPV